MVCECCGRGSHGRTQSQSWCGRIECVALIQSVRVEPAEAIVLMGNALWQARGANGINQCFLYV